MKATIEIIRRLRDSTGMKVNRNFSEFFADRLTRALNSPTLIDAVEELAQSLNCSVEYIGGAKLAAFVKEASSEKGPAIMEWCREHPKLVAMLAGLKDDDDLDAALQAIQLPEIREDDDSVVTVQPTYDVTIQAYCLTGLAHGADAKAGNATLFRRRAVITETGRHLYLPVYAGNALRGKMRDLLADHLVRSLGLDASRAKPSLALWAFHVLYAGGVLEGGASKVDAALGKAGAVRTDGIRNLRNMLPMLSLLGTAIGNRVIPGRIYVGDLRPCCREWGNGERPASELFAWEFLTRRDDYEGRTEDDDTSAMIAETEVLKPGTQMTGGIDIDDHASSLDRACLGRGLQLLAEHGKLGAENRRGLGKVRIEYDGAPDPEEYDQFLADNRAAILDYLEGLGALAKGVA